MRIVINGGCRLSLALAAVLFCAAPVVLAQSAGNFAGDFSSVTIIPTTTCTPTTTSSCSNTGNGVLTATIKQSGAQNKSLLLMGSLQSSIFTQTTVNSQNGNKSTSSVFGNVVVTPVVTDANGVAHAVYPSSVTYDSRLQSLTANLLGLGCTANTTGTITCTSPETIGLILDTTSANSFNFLVPNLPEGVYTVSFNVTAQAQVCPTENNSEELCTGTIQPGTSVDVTVGAGSLGVMTVQAQNPLNSLSF